MTKADRDWAALVTLAAGPLPTFAREFRRAGWRRSSPRTAAPSEPAPASSAQEQMDRHMPAIDQENGNS